MRLDEAYQAWGQQSENRELFKNTKDVFRRATWLLPTNQHCSYYTLEMIARAFAQTSMTPSDRAKAASVMCHVLNYAHTADPDNNPKPKFGYDEITHFKVKDMVTLEESPAPVRGQVPDSNEAADNGDDARGLSPDNESVGVQSSGSERPTAKEPMVKVKPAAKAKRMAELAKRDGGEAAKKAEKAVVQLDKDTLKPIKVWKSCHAPQTELGIRNVQRAVARHGLAGGYYWCRPSDVETFKPNSVRGQVPDRKKSATPAKRKPVKGLSPDRKFAPTTAAPVRDLSPDRNSETPTLADVTDEQLLAEIRRRGWKGQVTITKTIEL